ncbi:hypothetical protein MNBD_GAMMA12-2199 [hydrothermal vent metagenome]|uniref:Fido domain-containing protein n=1 Tax=hydrothermal vent metagenome TaxID=652676 RepID=A0A3B0YAK0_9ZZZZ
MNMDARTKYAFKELKKDNYLKNIPSLIFTGKLTKHITEILENLVFPDGNTRAIAVFSAYLIHQSGHRSRGMFVGKPKYFRDALVRSTTGDRTSLQNYFDENISLHDKMLPRGYDKGRGYDISDDR